MWLSWASPSHRGLYIGDIITVGECRPLSSKTVQFSVLKVTQAASTQKQFQTFGEEARKGTHYYVLGKDVDEGFILTVKDFCAEYQLIEVTLLGSRETRVPIFPNWVTTTRI
ncbi:hypothetical protein A6R68_16100 [Neotoma lepida]|uniref:40S ribosomal protein S11 N-terminal domain-containing protein n=1 Tax=Neotoma lepida TaxID=56216 RepID=A0A1A6HIC1_NEOLE|nr:hypothetical protein A6R68_16100 [Neotoma lepida]